MVDVNVLLSAALSQRGLPARVLDLATDMAFTLVVLDHIVETVLKAMEQPYFVDQLSREDKARITRALKKDPENVTPDPAVSGVAPDAEDDHVLGTAVAANADVFVTGDKGLLAIGECLGVRLVAADVFLAVLELR